jgi:HK97 family phage major capsid protein
MRKDKRELLDLLASKKNAAQALMNKEGVTKDEIKAATDEIQVIKAKIEALDALGEEPNGGEPLNKGPQNGDLKYKDVFYKAVAGKKLSQEEASLLESKAALSSTSDEDGGYLIPEDEVSAINELKREHRSLESLVTVEPVSTLSGSRVLEKDAEFTPFAVFAEGADVPASDSPQFKTITYTIKDRGGILPVPNNLLADNAANLRTYLQRWLAKKQVATRNNLIVTLLNTLTKTPVSGFDDLKSIFNVTLDPAISLQSVVVTNQDGFNWLDSLKDEDGKYVLQPDPVNKTVRRLFGIHPVEVYSNKTLPTRVNTGNEFAPIICGSLKEGVVLFDRQAMSLLTTNIGGDAFKKNRTDMRAITREDVATFDVDAIVFGEVQTVVAGG